MNYSEDSNEVLPQFSKPFVCLLCIAVFLSCRTLTDTQRSSADIHRVASLFQWQLDESAVLFCPINLVCVQLTSNKT